MYYSFSYLVNSLTAFSLTSVNAFTFYYRTVSVRIIPSSILTTFSTLLTAYVVYYGNAFLSFYLYFFISFNR